VACSSDPRPLKKERERDHQAREFAPYKGNLQSKSIRRDKAKRTGVGNPK
jgi:hypothetical protein